MVALTLISPQPFDIIVYLPGVKMPPPKQPIRQRGDNDFDMYMRGQMADHLNWRLPGDLFGEALGALSEALPQLYNNEGVMHMKGKDKLDCEMRGAYEGCKCCGSDRNAVPAGFDPRSMMYRTGEASMGAAAGMLQKLKHWNW